jgi:hypothetical protein
MKPMDGKTVLITGGTAITGRLWQVSADLVGLPIAARA